MPGRVSSRTKRCNAGAAKQPARQTQAADDRAAVGFFREVTRVDRRRVARPVRFGLDIAARQGPHLPRSGAEARGLVEFADLAGLKAAKPKTQPQQLIVELTDPDRPVSLGREQVEILEMVVGAVRPKWVSPQIAGFVVTFRFTPRARFRCGIPCDCGNLSGAVSGYETRGRCRAIHGRSARQIFARCSGSTTADNCRLRRVDRACRQGGAVRPFRASCQAIAGRCAV